MSNNPSDRRRFFLQFPIDGRRFFSWSPFRSWYFLAVSALCFAGLLYDVCLAYGSMHANRTHGLGAYFFIAIGFIYPWMATVSNHKRMRRLCSDGELNDVSDGSILDVALGLAAWGPVQNLFFSSLVMIGMEAIIGSLLRRAGS